MTHLNQMSDTLHDLRMVLRAGIQRSKQSSYGRLFPSRAAIPFLAKARSGLRAFVDVHPTSADGWNLLAQAEECFLNYAEARKCLERAMNLSGRRDRNHLKKLALYTTMEKEWSQLLLTPSQLKELGVFLKQKLSVESGGRTFRWTEAWLRERGFRDPAKVIDCIRARGAFDDFQVAQNLARG